MTTTSLRSIAHRLVPAVIRQDTFKSAVAFFVLAVAALSLIVSTGSAIYTDDDKDGKIDFKELTFKLKSPSANPNTWWNYGVAVLVSGWAMCVPLAIAMEQKQASMN
jgi:hypothetical protein